jgi:hypothetical protein
MATVSIQAIKGNGKGNLSYGSSKDGKSITITGTVYDADFVTKVRNGKVVESKQIGDKYYGVTCTVMIPMEDGDRVMGEVQQFLDNNAELGVTNPRVGLVFECRSLGKPVQGIHPVHQTKSMNIIVQRPTFLEVEEPPELFTSEDELDEMNAEAAQIATERSKESLLGALSRRLGLVSKSNEEEQEPVKETKKRKARSTK